MRIELDLTDDTLHFDGVCISLQCLRIITNPDEAVFYHFARRSDIVTVEVFKIGDRVISQLSQKQPN